jgi:NAD(P)-dependent dehydrogenase (short-subunit alcohol dehydrogenase family)
MSKSVVVTGATSGIGLATALELAGAGYDVIGTARAEEKATKLRESAEQRCVGIRTVILDVADAESTVRGFTEIARMTDGGPWAVVNNAGSAQPGAVEEVSDDDARAQMEINLMGPARIARLVLPTMRQRRDGRIVNISSVAARMSTPFTGWYCASKQALEGLTDALRMEVSRFGVKVVLIEPGGFGTGIWERGVGPLPPKNHSPYKDSYSLAERMRRQSSTPPDPLPVARMVRAALDSPRPRARYLVGADARAGTTLEALVPTLLSDYAKEVAMGLRTPPEQVSRVLRHIGRRRLTTLRPR